MAIQPVLTYPHPSLKQKIKESLLDQKILNQVLTDLSDTMNQHEGCVGLAAPQIGYEQRCVIVDVSRSSRAGENHGLLKLINPVILEASQWKVSREGCLSFPDLLANVKRAQKIRVSAYNEKLEPFEITSLGFEAMAVQHELDHLDGILFLDRIRSSKDLFERRKHAASL
ncbi:MAG TPA: peptide deformylase [bacterium]|jgi:peptide deformylase|nr:peptide deformylase [bacterium]